MFNVLNGLNFEDADGVGSLDDTGVLAFPLTNLLLTTNAVKLIGIEGLLTDGDGQLVGGFGYKRVDAV